MDPEPHPGAAGTSLDREIDALRSAMIPPGRDGVRDRHRLRLGELLVGRALGVRPSLQIVYGVRAAAEMAMRLTSEESRRDLRDAADELTSAVASNALEPGELTRAGRWLDTIRRLRLDPYGDGGPRPGTDAAGGHGRSADAARHAVSGARRLRAAGRDAEIATLRRAREDLPEDHPDRPVLMAEIGLAYAAPAEGGNGPRAAGLAAEALTGALGRTAGGHALQPALQEEVLLALAALLIDRDAVTDDLLDRIVAATRPESDPAHPLLAEAVHGLASVLRAADTRPSALERLSRVGEILGAAHPLHGVVMGVLGAGLARRAHADGDAAMMETAEDRLATAEASLEDSGDERAVYAVRVPRAGCQIMRARLARDPALAERAISTLESDLARLPATDPWTPRARSLLGAAWRLRGELLDRDADVRRGCELLISAGDRMPAAHPDATRIAAAAALARADLARLDDDPAGRDAAVRELTHVADRADLTAAERVALAARLTYALRARRGPGDAEQLRARLEQDHALPPAATLPPREAE